MERDCSLNGIWVEARNTLVNLFFLADQFKPGSEGAIAIVLDAQCNRIRDVENRLGVPAQDRMTNRKTGWSVHWQCEVRDWIDQIIGAAKGPVQ